MDINGDGVVNNYDRKAIGYPDVPEIVYGFGASVRWKGFDLSVFFQGVGNVNFFTNTEQTQPFSASKSRNANVYSDLWGNYWTPENPNAKYPRLTIGANENNNRLSTFWMVNGQLSAPEKCRNRLYAAETHPLQGAHRQVAHLSVGSQSGYVQQVQTLGSRFADRSGELPEQQSL